MAYVLRRRDRYMTGHGYATGIGYSFSWSPSIEDARRFADDDPSCDVFASRTGAKIVRVENTKKERRELGKRAMTCCTNPCPASTGQEV
jgi:hypothetical protein